MYTSDTCSPSVLDARWITYRHDKCPVRSERPRRNDLRRHPDTSRRSHTGGVDPGPQGLSRDDKLFEHAVDKQTFIATRHALLELQSNGTSTRAPGEPPSTSTWPVDRSAWDAYASVIHRWKLPLALVAVFGFLWLAGPTRWQEGLDTICVLCTYVTLVLCIDIVSDLTPLGSIEDGSGGGCKAD